MAYIMVLNDGETFTDLEGCSIVRVPDDSDSEAIEAQLDTATRTPTEIADDPDVIATFTVGHGRVEAWAFHNRYIVLAEED